MFCAFGHSSSNRVDREVALAADSTSTTPTVKGMDREAVCQAVNQLNELCPAYVSTSKFIVESTSSATKSSKKNNKNSKSSKNNNSSSSSSSSSSDDSSSEYLTQLAMQQEAQIRDVLQRLGWRCEQADWSQEWWKGELAWTAPWARDICKWMQCECLIFNLFSDWFL